MRWSFGKNILFPWWIVIAIHLSMCQSKVFHFHEVFFEHNLNRKKHGGKIHVILAERGESRKVLHFLIVFYIELILLFLNRCHSSMEYVIFFSPNTPPHKQQILHSHSITITYYYLLYHSSLWHLWLMNAIHGFCACACTLARIFVFISIGIDSFDLIDKHICICAGGFEAGFFYSFMESHSSIQYTHILTQYEHTHARTHALTLSHWVFFRCCFVLFSFALLVALY